MEVRSSVDLSEVGLQLVAKKAREDPFGSPTMSEVKIELIEVREDDDGGNPFPVNLFGGIYQSPFGMERDGAMISGACRSLAKGLELLAAEIAAAGESAREKDRRF